MTSEVEALAKVYGDAYEALWATGEHDKHSCHEAALEAVRATVRAQDRARGGTLSAEQLSRMASACDGDEGAGTLAEMLGQALDHSAAQGRTMAALEERCKAEIAKAITAESERDEARATIAARDARIAELVAMGGMDEERILAAKKRLGEALARAVAAESALATLRQAVEPIADEARALVTSYDAGTAKDEDGMSYCVDDLRHLIAAYDATPDTAALRAIRQRAKELVRRDAAAEACDHRGRSDFFVPCQKCGGAVSEEELMAFVRGLLGDSGPSGGGEKRCHCCHKDGTSCDGTPCDCESTTPPDAAAEACGPIPNAFGAICILPPGHAGGHSDGTSVETLPDAPTTEDDWRTVDDYLALRGGLDDADEARAALARLKDAPRKAAAAQGCVVCSSKEHPLNQCVHCAAAIEQRSVREAKEAMRARCASYIDEVVRNGDDPKIATAARLLAAGIRALSLD